MKNILILIIAISTISCQSKFDGYFFISNGSKDQPNVRMTVLIDTDTIFNQITKYSDIRPDLQYTPNTKIDEGKHIVKVIADNSIVKSDTIKFTGNRWIFISYLHKAPLDSTELERINKELAPILKHDSTYMWEFRMGSKPDISIYTMDKEPIHQ